MRSQHLRMAFFSLWFSFLALWSLWEKRPLRINLLSLYTTSQGENEKEKPSGESTATPTSTGTSQAQAAAARPNSAASTPMGASPWGVNSMGMSPQYYTGYQSAYPYYATGYPMYNMANTNPLTAQGYPTAATSQNSATTNQAVTVQTPANQNVGVNESASSVRQRTSVNQSTASQNAPPSAPIAGNASQNNSAVVDTQPRITQSSMFSLIVLWVLAVSIIALVCRRLFVVSW